MLGCSGQSENAELGTSEANQHQSPSLVSLSKRDNHSKSKPGFFIYVKSNRESAAERVPPPPLPSRSL